MWQNNSDPGDRALVPGNQDLAGQQGQSAAQGAYFDIPQPPQHRFGAGAAYALFLAQHGGAYWQHGHRPVDHPRRAS
ncbi:hypothetical protein THIOKS11180012 [Thiocapsa sp. KS1]|nr:hypothetical protein THIOKS11180012 [Thiocapsa sp. KS1]